MNELEQIFTEMLNHKDEHWQAYNKPQWDNNKIVKAWIKTNESKLKNLFISGVTNCAILETMHQQVFTEFHNLRKQKGNTEFIQVNGKEANEIIRLGKLATKKEHCL